jgi:predicted MFS family arabinose efflux permease
MLAGTLLLALGTALVPLSGSHGLLLLTLGVLAPAGAGAVSFSILIGAVAGRLPLERRSFAAGFINAGSSLGQFVFAPVLQALIALFGWAAAMLALAASSLLILPLIARMRPGAAEAAIPRPAATPLGEQLGIALRDRSYLLLHASFFTCGVHIAFLATHLPGEVALCGLPGSVSANALALIGLFNIAGSLGAGWLGGRFPMKSVLGWMYASRALAIALYLMAPRTPETFYVFAAALGISWLATVPPTAGLVGKLFGPRHIGTLFALALLSHQIGAFFGAWLGGVTITRFGDYSWMWYADMALALMAAISCIPIREPRSMLAQPA